MTNIIDLISTAVTKFAAVKNLLLTKERFANIFSTTYTWKTSDSTLTATAASNYTVSDAEINLVGHMIRVKLRATRSSNTSAGNVTNEEVATLTWNHGGRIKGLYNISSRNYDGTLATFQTSCSTSGNTSTVTVKLCATHAATKEIYFWDNLPAVINVSMY